MKYAILGAVTVAAVYVAAKAMRSEPAADSERALLDEGGSLAVVGDSLAVGLRPSLSDLAAKAGVPFEYRAKGGSRTEYWVDAIDSIKGDVLLVVLGTNDAAGKASGFEEAMDMILQRARARSMAVVWAHPTGVHLPSAEKVDALLRRAHAEGLMAELVPAPELGDDYAKDRIHLSPDGYRRWANEIWQTLTR